MTPIDPFSGNFVLEPMGSREIFLRALRMFPTSSGYVPYILLNHASYASSHLIHYSYVAIHTVMYACLCKCTTEIHHLFQFQSFELTESNQEHHSLLSFQLVLVNTSQPQGLLHRGNTRPFQLLLSLCLPITV